MLIKKSIKEFLSKYINNREKDTILTDIILHKIELSKKYNSAEFENLPHMDKFDSIIQDSIIPNVYNKRK